MSIMERTRTCTHCGKEFPRQHKQKYCSAECRLAGARWTREQRREKKKEKEIFARQQGIIDMAKIAKEQGMSYGAFAAMQYASMQQKGVNR